MRVQHCIRDEMGANAPIEAEIVKTCQEEREDHFETTRSID